MAKTKKHFTNKNDFNTQYLIISRAYGKIFNFDIN